MTHYLGRSITEYLPNSLKFTGILSLKTILFYVLFTSKDVTLFCFYCGAGSQKRLTIKKTLRQLKNQLDNASWLLQRQDTASSGDSM